MTPLTENATTLALAVEVIVATTKWASFKGFVAGVNLKLTGFGLHKRSLKLVGLELVLR